MSRFVAIRSEGGLIPFDTIDALLRGELPGQKPADFGLERTQHLGDEIARAWSDALDYWHIFWRRMEALPDNDPGTTLTRERWALPVLADLLGYELTYQPSGAQVGGKTYPISHRAGAGEEAPPVHIVGFRQDLDRRDETGHRRMSPQGLVQEYINRSEHLWGVVTNGLRFRLLRDTTRTSRPTYLEFDLQSILEAGRFSEFVVFYRLCHRTRLPKTIDETKDCLLERYYQASIDEGLRVRDQLRDAVEVALKKIGTGLLQHPSDDALRGAVKSGQLTPEQYYRELLRLIYRVLFLMVAEERQMVLVPGPEAERRQQIYDRLYSLRRLRDIAERPIEEGPYGDLWAGLQETFRLFTNGGENALGIPPLNGHLFGPDAIPHLEGTSLYNHDLLVALRHLSVFEVDGTPNRVNYAGLDVEELGSVYESLLDFQPTLESNDGAFMFDLKTGTERKSTGSYYTSRELVSELVESALIPALEDRLTPVTSREERERAVLTMTVCDPACGSGHFLLAAGRRMARELARIRTGEDEPTPEEFRRALRDAIQHCLYGVDKNPLAVDLCKVALWIEGHNPGLPLSFLDHRIKCGDSLVGVLSMDELAGGIPDAAFHEVLGDDKPTARALRRRNAAERKAAGTQVQLLAGQITGTIEDLVATHTQLDRLPESTVTDIHEKERRYRELRGEGSSWWMDWTAANLWTAAFFIPLTKATAEWTPTTRHLRAFLESHSRAAQVDAANRLSQELRFFHWPLEFPEIFARGGFNVVLGNPPWEKLTIVEREWWGPRDRDIAETKTKAERGRKIEALQNSKDLRKQALYEEWQRALREPEAVDKFIKTSGRFSLTARGEVNTYRLFAELAVIIVTAKGMVGLVVKTGLVNAEDSKEFFSAMVEGRRIVSVYDFKNWQRWFPDVAFHERFCLVTLSGIGQPQEAARYLFYALHPRDLRDEQRVYTLSAEEIALFNPNSKTCPVFASKTDLELARKVYTRFPVLVDERTRVNPWGIRYVTMFHMAGDSEIFEHNALERLLADGFQVVGRNRMQRDKDVLVPLYEGKLLHIHDHRFATFEGVPSSQRFGVRAATRAPSLAQKQDPSYEILPRYWVPMDAYQKAQNHYQLNQGWMFVFRDVTNVLSNARTALGCIAPAAAAGHKAPLLIFEGEPRKAAQRALLFAALWGSVPFDFIVRQKMFGASLQKGILYQIASPDPTALRSPLQVSGRETTYAEYLTALALELIYVTYSLSLFAEALGITGEPYRWDAERRHVLRCTIDAAVAHLYGFAEEDLDYIYSTLPIVRDQEMNAYKTFKSRDLGLAAYREISQGRRPVLPTQISNA